ncbi:MAG: FAD-dependent oxidoreductase, partial [archaeon]|nr:FAD-dependent oxidoreductase [archaeon]
MIEKKPKIVVIGGGHAGLAFIKAINSTSSHFELTLIDKKDFYEINFVNLWELVAPYDINNQHRIKYEDFINTRFIQGEVKEISDKNIILESGEQIIYDYTIIAVGTHYPRFEFAKTVDFKTIQNAENAIKKEYNNIKNSKSALIIGGGVVGVELAGEIKSKFPDMEVQLIHGAPQLMELFHPKTGKIAYKILEKLGIRIFLNELIELNPNTPNTYKSKKGNEFTAECVYLTFGVKPNTRFLDTNDHFVLTNKREITIDRYFRVIKSKNIFAIGDAAAVGEGKQGIYAFMQGKYLGKNFFKI